MLPYTEVEALGRGRENAKHLAPVVSPNIVWRDSAAGWARLGTDGRTRLARGGVSLSGPAGCGSSPPEPTMPRCPSGGGATSRGTVPQLSMGDSLSQVGVCCADAVIIQLLCGPPSSASLAVELQLRCRATTPGQSNWPRCCDGLAVSHGSYVTATMSCVPATVDDLHNKLLDSKAPRAPPPPPSPNAHASLSTMTRGTR